MAITRLLEGCKDVRVFLDEGELRPGEDLASKARDGRMADVVLVPVELNEPTFCQLFQLCP